MVEGAKTGDRFINPGSKKVYVVTKAVIDGDWVVLKGEDGEGQILTSKESMETWIKEKGLGKVTPNLVGFGYRLRKL